MLAWLRKKTAAASAKPIAQTDAVTLSEVTVDRGERTVLDGISLSLNERSIGLVGDNGSGKSTLLKLLNGLLLPDAGTVNVFGHDTRQHGQFLPALAGFIFQNPDHQLIFPTVAEELAFGLEQLGQSAEEAETGARAFLRQYRVEALADKPVHCLSEGQKQFVCVLSVLIMRPRLLLLDEPFSSLDLTTRHRLLGLMQTQAERVLMVSHDLELLAGFERVIWLRDGGVHRDGVPAEVLPAYRADAMARLHAEPAWGTEQ